MAKYVKIPSTRKPKGMGVVPVRKSFANALTGYSRISNPYRGMGKRKKGVKFSTIIRGMK